ncbi:MAG: hypothetical protein Q9170_007848, partial [Blastenia crenularia]
HVQDAHQDRMWAAVQDFCGQYNDNEPYHSNGIDQKYTWHDDELTQIFDTNDSTDDVYEMSIESVDHCDPGPGGYDLHYPVESTTCYLVLYAAWTKFLRRVWPKLPANCQVHLNSILPMINSKLMQANDILDDTIEKEDVQNEHSFASMAKGKLRRAAFAVIIKKSIDTTIRDLDQWQQNLLGPTWFQLVLVPGMQVDQSAKDSSIDDEVSKRTLADLRFLLS